MKFDDDDFALLGLPVQFSVDPAELEQRWKMLQAQVHPDRFVAQGVSAQRVAMQWAARVNEAYQRLKDPLRRAAYLCQRHGVAPDVDNNTAVPTAFLMQQMAWRESLDEARDVMAVEVLAGEVKNYRQGCMEQLVVSLDQEQDWQRASGQVRELMFVDRFLRAVDQRLDILES